ncbi:uncharacterized protein LOC124361072 [Homalodisca vitripennis]|uniref:uncharacterized protein LOC124361072 n=1 Tax=Homalodisca vitripennis TaxID=197043 RepID=UPI001EEC83AD|nr:uncharacterized protein LOC124361072 [Homalodisca vitripennis]
MSAILRDHPTMSPRLLCLLASLAVTVHARTAGSAPANDLQDYRAKSDVAEYLADIRLLYKLYEECSAAEFGSCLKKKIVVALDRAAKSSKHLTLAEGLTFVKDSAAQDSAPVSEKELETSLPRSLEDRDNTLNQMILDKIIHFFKTHTLEFKLFEDGDRSLEEGRGRRKGLNSLLMLPLLLGGTFIPLAFGALALLAGKALIVSKLALALAAIIGLKKLVGGGGGGESYQVVSVPHHGAGHYKRSLDDEAHQLAYKGHLGDNFKGA